MMISDYELRGNPTISHAITEAILLFMCWMTWLVMYALVSNLANLLAYIARLLTHHIKRIRKRSLLIYAYVIFAVAGVRWMYTTSPLTEVFGRTTS